ncbi:MAG TPA: hypothetical protein VMF59_06520, partial [Bacteroidota bacterium]|nr:hypothetical protein [Bacteroidota bacterium]
FHVGVSIILGLPAENRKDGERTLRFVRRLPAHYYLHNVLWLFPGTPLWDSGSRFGIERTLDLLGLPVTTNWAYNPLSLRPGRGSSQEKDARVARLLAADAVYSCATGDGAGHGTSAVILDGAELTRESASWIRTVLDVGGLLLHVLPLREGRTAEELIRRDRKVAAEALLPVRHHFHLQREGSTAAAERWLVACAAGDLMRIHKPRVVTLHAAYDAAPLRDWLIGKDTDADSCEVSEYLTHPAEINAFLRRAGRGNVLEAVRHRPVPPAIRYAGRWLKGTTPCRALSRLEVDGAGCVRSCRHGGQIGVVGDTRRTLHRAIFDAIASAEARRGCRKCSLPQCPRCPFPGVPEREYCATMHSRARAIEFLGVLHVCSRIPLLLASGQGFAGEG